MPIQKIKSGRILSPEINNFIGNKGQLFFDEDTGQLRLSDGITPGGIDILGGGSGGPVAWTSITGKPDFTTVSTSGSYTDLINTPTIPADISDLTDTGNLLGGGSTGDFIFAAGDVSLPLNYSTMTLSTYQNGGNKESRLTLSTSGISSLDVGNNFRIRNGYGTGFEHEWLFNANGNLALPGSGGIIRNGVSVLFDGTYSPATAGDWSSPAPTTIEEALDRLATLVKTLNSGTGA